jgi:hypothetical protein
MGGNALSVTTRRTAKSEYLSISSYVLSNLQKSPELTGHRIVVIKAYADKESFGDLDVLLETFSGDTIDYTQLIQSVFNPTQIVQNSHVYSFDYNEFQVDLILTPHEDYDTSCVYYSYNDLGNLLGRIFKKLGFKYGHRGLSYIFRENDDKFNAFAEVIVSRDIEQILEFGGYDYARFTQGFDNLDDIFKYVASSKYFHKDIYLLHNRNHASRTRDKKRKTYNLFLQWCDSAENLPTYPWTEMREQDGYAGKPEFLATALNTFDGFNELYNIIMSEHEQSKLFKTLFNGSIVSAETGLVGKELGSFMSYFLDSQGGKDLFRETTILDYHHDPVVTSNMLVSLIQYQLMTYRGINCG